MSQPAFAALLQREVAPLLAQAGYGYDERLRAGDEIFGLRKALGGDAQAVVQFQRRATTDEFTVNLLRVKSDQIAPRLYGGAAEARGARLSYVLWYVYGLRLYPASDWWWRPAETDLRDVAEQLGRYGLPWLEQTDAPRPWEMPMPRTQEWVQAARTLLNQALLAWGFQWQAQPLVGEMPCLRAVREQDACDIVELQPAYSLDPAEFTFDVCLRRAAAPDQPSESDSRASLAQLRWQMRRGGAAGLPTVDEAKTLLWRYADRAELDAQLQDVLLCLQHFGLAWFNRVGREA